MHSLSETSRKQHNHRSCIYHELTLQQDEPRAKILLHMLSILCTKHVNHELNLWHAHSQAIAHVIFVRSARDLHHHFLIVFHCMNLERAEFLFSICAAYANCNSHCLTVSHSNHLVNLLFHSLDFQRWCFHHSSMFLYAQLMLRICIDEALMIGCEFYCDLA